LARFRIEGSTLDVEALEARVDAAIEAKRGTRFTDEELNRLRNEPLEPRLRREDLPRGLMEELSAVRGRLQEVAAPPAVEPATVPARERPDLGSQLAPPSFGPAGHLWATGSAGLKGAFLRIIRRVARPFVRATTNLEDVLDEMMIQQRDYAREMVAATERDVTSLEQRLERSFDVLKDNLDGRIDRTADWAGAQMTATSGTLEERQERALHLAHNMVVELTNARLDLQQTQARLNEMARRMTELEMRGRTLEKLTLPPGEARDD